MHGRHAGALRYTGTSHRPVADREIDILHGWHELELSKEMQLHYATLVLRERIQRARINGLM